MRKTLLALVVVVGVFLALASGCAMMAERPQPTAVPTTSAQTTQTTKPSTDAPTAPLDGSTAPTDAPTEPPATQPPVTEPPVTEPPVTEPPVTVPPTTEPPATQPTKPKDPNEKLTVCIDAGHQRYGIYEKEPNGPGSSVMKAKLTSGTRGVSTKIAEYQLNLEVSLLLEQELMARGYNVVMIRRTNDCPLSNAERAQVANDSGADIFVRIHANGSENSAVSGMLTCAPTSKNPYLSDGVIRESIRLSKTMVDAFCAVTGAKNQGVLSTDTMTGINWCQIPVTIVEMGYMSNPPEDEKMATDEYRALMVQGIADGIDAYFNAE